MAKPFTRIEWTLERAGSEFNINHRTLANRLRQAGIDPDAGGKWTTLQIVRAIYSDLESERIRKTRAEADQIETQNREAEGRLIDKEEFAKRYDPIFIDCVRIVRSSRLTEVEQDELLGGLAKVHEVK